MNIKAAVVSFLAVAAVLAFMAVAFAFPFWFAFSVFVFGLLMMLGGFGWAVYRAAAETFRHEEKR